MEKRILWLSHNPLDTFSFSQQTNLLCGELVRRGYAVHVLGVGKKNAPEKYNGYWLYPYPRDLAKKKNTHLGSEILINEYLDIIQPDVLITLGNIANYEYLPQVLEQKNKKFHWLHWGPSETNNIYKENIPLEKKIPYYIVLSQANLKTKKTYRQNVYKIGHAVDPAFKPLRKNNKKFVFGCLAVNNVRKQLVRLLEAFAEFAQDKTNVQLLLFTNSFDPKDPQSTDLEHYINNIFKIKNKVKVIYSDKFPSPPAPEYLNKFFYNAIDVFVSATAGEGFCIPLAEAMACKKPVIITKCPNVTEIVINGRTGLFCRTVAEVYDLVPRTYTKWFVVDTRDLAKKMQLLYRHKKLYQKISSQAYLHVKNNFSLEAVVNKIENLINKANFKNPHQDLDPGYFTNWLGLEYFKYGFWQDCYNILKGQADAGGYNLCGHALKRLGRPAEAKIFFEKALQLEPGLEIAKKALQELSGN